MRSRMRSCAARISARVRRSEDGLASMPAILADRRCRGASRQAYEICRLGLLRHPLRIECHFPDMTVGVLEVAGVAAPEGFVRRLQDRCARRLHLRHDAVDFIFGTHVVRKGELGRTAWTDRQAGVVSDALTRPECETQARLQLKEHDCSVLELLADDAFRRKSKPVAIEAQRLLQVFHAQCYKGD